MDWVADIGSIVAACGAVGAAWQATRLVKKSQAQNDLAQRELFASNRPIVIPTWKFSPQLNADGTKWIDLTGDQVIRIQNIGPGVALNLSIVMFGPPPASPSGLLPNRVISWLEPPLRSGEERTITLKPGSSNFNGDVRIDNDPQLSLFAPPTPSARDLMLGAADHFLARLTMTYHDVLGRRHSGTYDADVLSRWLSRSYREGIATDLWDIESDLGASRVEAARGARAGVGG